MNKNEWINKAFLALFIGLFIHFEVEACITLEKLQISIYLFSPDSLPRLKKRLSWDYNYAKA